MSWYFLREDRILIEQLHRFKGYGAKTLVKDWGTRSSRRNGRYTVCGACWRNWRKLARPAVNQAADDCDVRGRRRILTSSSVKRTLLALTDCQRDRNSSFISDTHYPQRSGVCCRSECTRLQSVTWSSCDSGWLRHGASSSRPWWTTPLTSGEHDKKLVFRQTVVISNSACDVICGTIFSHHSTTGSFQSHPTTECFQSHPLFPEENNINFDFKKV